MMVYIESHMLTCADVAVLFTKPANPVHCLILVLALNLLQSCPLYLCDPHLVTVSFSLLSFFMLSALLSLPILRTAVKSDPLSFLVPASLLFITTPFDPESLFTQVYNLQSYAIKTCIFRKFANFTRILKHFATLVFKNFFLQ